MSVCPASMRAPSRATPPDAHGVVHCTHTVATPRAAPCAPRLPRPCCLCVCVCARARRVCVCVSRVRRSVGGDQARKYCSAPRILSVRYALSLMGPRQEAPHPQPPPAAPMVPLWLLLLLLLLLLAAALPSAWMARAQTLAMAVRRLAPLPPPRPFHEASPAAATAAARAARRRRRVRTACWVGLQPAQAQVLWHGLARETEFGVRGGRRPRS